MHETLSPQERIKKKRDFLLIYRRGKRYRGKYLILIYLPNDLKFSRMAVVTSKKIGNAVKRNKIKRWIRTLYRRNKKLLKNSLDLIIISKKEIQEASWLALKEEYLTAIKSICQKHQSL